MGDIKGAVAQTLELRTEYENEQKIWNEKLGVLLKRQLAAFDMVTERTGIVYHAPPSLKIRDPEHLGSTTRKKVVGRAKAVAAITKVAKGVAAAKIAKKPMGSTAAG